jgi:hypothetical protein
LSDVDGYEPIRIDAAVQGTVHHREGDGWRELGLAYLVEGISKGKPEAETSLYILCVFVVNGYAVLLLFGSHRGFPPQEGRSGEGALLWGVGRKPRWFPE